MRQRGRCLLICGVVLAALGAGVALASTGPPVFPIPGFAANQLEVGGVSRLNDGGALVAGSLSAGARSPDRQPVVLRLLVDGSIDLGYGSEGISTPRIGADAQATSLAIDPQTGEAWIGVVAGPAHRGAVVALTGAGVRQTHFGHDGILELGAMNGPVTLAWRPGELLVASGTQPCPGCQLTVVNPATGAAMASSQLTPAQLTGEAGCSTGAITGAVLVTPSSALLAFRGASHCTAQLVTVAISRRSGHGSLRMTRAASLTAAATTDRVAAFGSNICFASSSPTATEFGPFLDRRQAFTPSRAPAGRLISLVALGQGACAALIATDRPPGTVVAQASAQQRQSTRDAIPRTVEPLGMFRCHAHLLVIGAQAQNRQRAGVVVVIPVRRGPPATTASTAAAGGQSGRCS
jgi:hypothetical protein